MPAVSSTGGALVLVTGANGYIATWVVQALLEKGYTVRGTVRSEEKGKRLNEYFDSTPYGSKLEWVVVDDISKVHKNIRGLDFMLTVTFSTEHSTRPLKVLTLSNISPLRIFLLIDPTMIQKVS